MQMPAWQVMPLFPWQRVPSARFRQAPVASHIPVWQTPPQAEVQQRPATQARPAAHTPLMPPHGAPAPPVPPSAPPPETVHWFDAHT